MSHHCTCLRSHPYEARDILLHYFGCLRQENREAFYDSLGLRLQLLIRDEQSRIQERRVSFEARDDRLVRQVTIHLSILRQSSRWRTMSRRGPAGLENLGPSPTGRYGLKANMILFKDSRKYTDKHHMGEFPNQRIPINELLYNKDQQTNPLMKECPNNMIRYFHLPANNMSWAEEAIARYYNEDTPEYSGIFRVPEHPSKTYMMLRPEFWRGQQQGGWKDTVHVRYMRSRCDSISTDLDSIEDSPRNLALFMPYLHWETDWGRSKQEKSISSIREKREKDTSLHTVAEVVEAKVMESRNRPTVDAKFRKREEATVHRVPTTILGRFLFYAAKLLEAMDDHLDNELVRENLYKDPPLHPRRTLSQAQYRTPKTTKTMDRDQVVYRATAPQKEFMHHHFCRKEKEQCDHHHCNWTSRDGCNQCQHDIRRVGRVVMVDQLWLWILDGNTIITCFPKRWGRNKPDSSAVHKSLRLRLNMAREDEIRSAYDLALIIIDQCCGVFFDRTKTADRQPRVMDLFESAIGEVIAKQKISSEHARNYTRMASEMYKSRDGAENGRMPRAFLDISLEDQLTRETKHIIGELLSMIQIKRQQELVLAEFVKHANHALEEVRRSHPEESGTKTMGWGTREYAQQVEANLKNQASDLSKVSQSAEDVLVALRDLSDFKQQQAGVVLAYMAVRQGNETLRQGRSIMLFTVVTIIFLPLSFFTGVYGMNNVEFNGGNYGLYEQLSYMLPISFGIIIISFILAFSSSVRSGIFFIQSCFSFVFGLVWTYLVTSTGLYSLRGPFWVDSWYILALRRKYEAHMKATATRSTLAKQEARQVEKIRKLARQEADLSAKYKLRTAQQFRPEGV